MGKLMERFDLREPLRAFAAGGRPVWGTCAGMILLARDVGRQQPGLDLMDVRVKRNAFGRQLDSFETGLAIPALGDPDFPAVFIRAPAIESVGAGVDSLATLPDGTIVAARQGNLLATAFHPELTNDPRLHQYFLEMRDEGRDGFTTEAQRAERTREMEGATAASRTPTSSLLS
jgi:5'-phosphate synthase pdxT subunit